ncbi:hypothetical protein PG985_014859 [Apiospora marii]|uniref:uncharacterized protein n=1 Tax=Apiospora marii TaxID=335849 RepID=UPI00312FBD9D
MQAKEQMYRICIHQLKGQKANGTPRNVALEDRTVFDEAKDAVIPAWRAVKLLSSMILFKLELAECLTSEGMRLIVNQIAAEAAAANTRNGGGGNEDNDNHAGRDETREEETLRLVFSPPIYEAIEKFVARVKTAPFGTRLEDMFPETLETENDNGADDDDDDGVDNDDGRANPIAIPSIEDPSIEEGGNANSIPASAKHKEKTPSPFLPETYTRINSSELPDPDFRVALKPDRQAEYDALEKGWEEMHPNNPTRLQMEEMDAAAKREAAASARRRPNNRRGKKNRAKQRGKKSQVKRRVDNDQALPPTPPQSSQPVRDPSPVFIDLEATQPPDIPDMEEQEEGEEEADQPLLLHAGHPLGLGSSPAPPETENNIMHTDFDQFIWEFEPDLPLAGPSSSSGPPEPPSSHREKQPSPIADARPTPEQTPGQEDLGRPTPARSESGLFVPQIKETPVPPPEPWWLTYGQAKREETLPPLSVIASQGAFSSSRDTSTRPPSQPAAERRQRSAGASKPTASRSSSRAAGTTSGASAGTPADEQAAQRAAVEDQHQPQSSSTSTQSSQSEGHDAVTAADPNSDKRPPAKKPRKVAEKSKKAEATKNNKAKKQKGKDKGKGKEVEQGAGGQTGPGPVVADPRSEEALRQQLANTEKPRRATYIGAPALAGSIEDLRRREKTIIMPPVPQILSTAATVTAAVATNPAPMVEAVPHERNESSMPSSSQSRAPQVAPTAPRKKPESNRNDTTTPSPPDKQRQKQQHIRHQSICPTFEGTHIRLDDDEPAQCVLGQSDRGVTVERVPSSSPAAAAATRSHVSSEAPPVQPPVRQTVEEDESPDHRQDSPTSLKKQRNKAKWARYKQRRRNKRSGRDSTTVPPSPAAPLPESEPTHGSERGQAGSSSGPERDRQHSTTSHRGSAMPPPPLPLPPRQKSTSAATNRRGSAVPPPAPAGPPRGRYSTPWEWRGEDSVSPEQQKRSRDAADLGRAPDHNKKRRMGSTTTDRHGTSDIVDLTSVPLPGPSSSSTHSFTYAAASTAPATSVEKQQQQQQQVGEYPSSAPPRQQAEDHSHAHPSAEAYACKRRFMSVPPPLNAGGGYRVAEVAHKPPAPLDGLFMLRVEKRLMNLENQLGHRE